MIGIIVIFYFLISCTQCRHDRQSGPEILNIPPLFKAVFEHITNETNLLHFHGKSTHATLKSAAALNLNGKSGYHNWHDVAKAVNESSKRTSLLYKAVRIQNDLSLGDLLQLVTNNPYSRPKLRKRGRRNKFASETSSGLITLTNISFQRNFLDFGQPPVVLTNTIDENWGFFSTKIVNRTTTRWLNLTNHLIIHNHDYHSLRCFLDAEKVSKCKTDSLHY